MLDDATLAQAARLLDRLRERGLMVATAESCTGGLVAASLTHHSGSSDVVAGGFVTYSNIMKHRLLKVPMELFEQVGAVSEAVAVAMAEGARDASGADLAVSITGIAGPGGGSAGKPVGLVWLATARAGQTSRVEKHIFAGNRSEIRAQAVSAALLMLAAE